MGATSSHFPVYSEGEKVGVRPGESVLRDEVAEPDSMRGTPIGYVHLALRRSKRYTDEVMCRAVFNFDDRKNTLSASGVLPYDEVEDVGDGELAIIGGTGEYAGWKGVVTVTVLGPKRWSVDGGP